MFFESLAVVAVSGAIYLLTSYASSWRLRLIQRQTGVADIPFLDIARLADHKIPGSAVVCGGSIAGLVTARICHDHFERVIIVEPEAWLATSEGWKPEREPKKRVRARVSQYQSINGLLAFGFMALEKMFPKLREECQKANISIGAADFKFAFFGHFANLPDENSLLNTLFATRHGFETLLRRLVIGNQDYPNIEQIVGTVTGVIPSDNDPTMLHGVSVRTSNGDEILPASLIIDCSGAAQAGLKWLRRAGFGTITNYKPDDNHVHPLQHLNISYEAHIRYSTFQFTITPALAKRLPIPGGYYDSKAIYFCAPDRRVDQKGLGVTRCEGDTLQVICSTRGDVDRPSNLDEIKAFVRDMIVDKPIPGWLFQLLDELHEVEADVTISNVRLPPMSYIQYHQANNLPNNLIAIGDSIMRVNPIYGHGCSKAIIGAVTLNTILMSLDSRSVPGVLPANFSKLFFETQAAKIDPIWEGTKLLDYGYDCTVPLPGETLSIGWFVRWYSYRLFLVSFYDQQAGLAVWNGLQLLSPGIDLFQPGIVLKILWDVLRRPFA